MIGDWIYDHFGWIIAAVIVAITGVIIGLVVSGTVDASCPKGQIERLLYFQPVITKNVTTFIPIYACEAAK